MDRFHDFAAKLRGPRAHASIARYLEWQRTVRSSLAQGKEAPIFPENLGPLSVNLDLTTACNFACDHCIDWDSLNSPVRYDMDSLRASLRALTNRGMQSIILIGGGSRPYTLSL
ncbi:MAG: hypothetical protein CMJ96_09255 [Planctomycetes bacterium]|nr:hypothetical protein [Planctomycetota bacterium]